MISMVTFFLAYVGFILFPRRKGELGTIAVMALVVMGVLGPRAAFAEVNWNVIGLFVGTLFLAELFTLSQVPAALAEWLVVHASSSQGALVALFGLSSVLSIFIENVAVVLLIAPLALSLCDKLRLPPERPLILLAMFSNLQGCATLIGDPPSMIVAGYLHLSFMDFFFLDGKPSLFFAVQLGALSTLLYAWWSFRTLTVRPAPVRVEQVLSWMPTVLLGALVAILAVASGWDPEAHWLAGTTAMLLAAVGLTWQGVSVRWCRTQRLVAAMDWQTTAFLAALFVLVAALRIDGWIDALAHWTVTALPGDLLTLYLFVIAISLVISAFIDNVPYLVAMIPIVQEISEGMEADPFLLVVALLIGTCLGGNITPIGAAANVVAVGLLDKHGTPIAYRGYLPVGLAFTACAVVPAAIFVWLIWG